MVLGTGSSLPSAIPRMVRRRILPEADFAAGPIAMSAALEAALERARQFGAMARDALAIFPDSVPKSALSDVVGFCVARAH